MTHEQAEFWLKFIWITCMVTFVGSVLGLFLFVSEVF